MSKIKIKNPAAKGYKLCNIFFTRFNEIGKIPFKKVCSILKIHDLDVVTTTNRRIPIDKLLHEYTNTPVTVDYIRHHTKLFRRFIELDISKLANNVYKMLDVYKSVSTDKETIRTYVKYIQCVSCISIMAHCFDVYLPDNFKLVIDVPVCRDNVCPIFKHLIHDDMPKNLDDNLLLKAILLYRLVTKILHYIHTTTIMTTNSKINNKPVGKPAVEILLDHTKMYAEIKAIKNRLDEIIGTNPNIAITKDRSGTKINNTKHKTKVKYTQDQPYHTTTSEGDDVNVVNPHRQRIHHTHPAKHNEH